MKPEDEYLNYRVFKEDTIKPHFKETNQKIWETT